MAFLDCGRTSWYGPSLLRPGGSQAGAALLIMGSHSWSLEVSKSCYGQGEGIQEEGMFFIPMPFSGHRPGPDIYLRRQSGSGSSDAGKLS